MAPFGAHQQSAHPALSGNRKRPASNDTLVGRTEPENMYLLFILLEVTKGDQKIEFMAIYNTTSVQIVFRSCVLYL